MKCACFADLSQSCSPHLTGKGFEFSFSALGRGQFGMFWFRKFGCRMSWFMVIFMVALETYCNLCFGFVLIFTAQVVLDKNPCLSSQIITKIFVIASLSFIPEILLFFIGRWTYLV